MNIYNCTNFFASAINILIYVFFWAPKQVNNENWRCELHILPIKAVVFVARNLEANTVTINYIIVSIRHLEWINILNKHP